MNDSTQRTLTLGAGFIALALMLVVFYTLQSRPATSNATNKASAKTSISPKQNAPTNGDNSVTQSVSIPETQAVTATVTVEKKK